jgi:hypothetical protein
MKGTNEQTSLCLALINEQREIEKYEEIHSAAAQLTKDWHSGVI